ncbi:hypothetical protein [Alteromonas macleodii]|uniref:Rap1a immunity protein domain-containing protein n=1 Tax=Alteromonas macleodii TaxID=28108 RepID=A0AB36FR06_ALTMA|nr:hypothetical protein [Alteromonas macleodii]OES24489.1 hypothetical protein BFV95_4756 [Alteromonas macleodii]OES25546.1 hypothetical protein BFV94_4399 [Alteromonas macleodii]OES25847.1 hypothetical protein BFV93_4310 [Alteromonas macleodii]OES38631.1 hypothetical protein BFV96_4742 [Alteromonas macleodii]
MKQLLLCLSMYVISSYSVAQDSADWGVLGTADVVTEHNITASTAITLCRLILQGKLDVTGKEYYIIKTDGAPTKYFADNINDALSKAVCDVFNHSQPKKIIHRAEIIGPFLEK